MEDIDVDELVKSAKKKLQGGIQICPRCNLEMENKGIRMSMNVNYYVYKCPKCLQEKLVYKGPSGK